MGKIVCHLLNKTEVKTDKKRMKNNETVEKRLTNGGEADKL